MVCRLGFIRGVEFSDGTASLCPAASTQGPTVGAPAQTELPSCPVCLERLDEHVSGVVVTVCNHAFHNECLLKWGDTSCPVCRFCLQPTGTARCATCGASDSLWMCLICGAVGCGRYSGGHARAHWEAHGHSYALELDTQRVWDYVGDGWVHRLVQSKAAGAAGETFIVEVSSGGGAAGEFVGSLGPGGDEVGGADAKARRETEEEGKPGGRKPSKSGMKVEGGAGMEAEWAHRSEEDVVLESRMEAVTREYEHLLTSQLESQRLWFEGQMERQAEDLLRRQRVRRTPLLRLSMSGHGVHETGPVYQGHASRVHSSAQSGLRDLPTPLLLAMLVLAMRCEVWPCVLRRSWRTNWTRRCRRNRRQRAGAGLCRPRCRSWRGSWPRSVRRWGSCGRKGTSSRTWRTRVRFGN